MSYEILHLDSEERVILEVRKHWIVFVSQILVFIFSAIVPPTLFLILKIYYPVSLDFISFSEYLKVFLFLYIIWLLAFWLGFFINWTKYFLDVWYVTEKRIIDVEQKRIFHREISNLRFDKIQDVSIEVRGLLATMLDFGDIKVQTAAENSQDFFMSHVKNPEEVKRVIFGQHNIVGDKNIKDEIQIDV